MSMGKRVRERQPEMWVATTNFPTAASQPFYTRLNQRLDGWATAAGGWLVAAQNAAQSQNGDTLFLKLIQEEVIFI
jgi:hypothetical protein